jgi:uncharacterized protein YjbI with pentapeptide repeats
MRQLNNRNKLNISALLLLIILSIGVPSCMKPPLDESQEKLLQDIKQFNKTIGENGWNLNGKSIEKKDIGGVHLANSLWEDVDVNAVSAVSSRFEGSNFTRVKFTNIDMSKSIFVGCTFNDCKFIGSKFRETTFSQCTFIQSQFEKTDMNKSLCQNLTLSEINAKDIEWQNARLINVSFNKCECEEVSYTHSDMGNVSFSESKLVNIDFSDSELKQCNFNIEGNLISFLDSKFEHLTITGNPKINDLKLAGIKGAGLIIENLNESEFLTMSFAEVSGLRLANSSLSLTSCISATFYDTVFRNTSFNFAQFDGSRFTGVYFDNVAFDDEIIFDDTTIEGITFTNIRKLSNYKGSFKNTKYEGKEPF